MSLAGPSTSYHTGPFGFEIDAWSVARPEMGGAFAVVRAAMHGATMACAQGDVTCDTHPTGIDLRLDVRFDHASAYCFGAPGAEPAVGKAKAAFEMDILRDWVKSSFDGRGAGTIRPSAADASACLVELDLRGHGYKGNEVIIETIELVDRTTREPLSASALRLLWEEAQIPS